MPVPAPETWEDAIAPYGIRAPKPTAPAYKLPTALNRMATDVSTALAEFGLPPVVSAAVIVAASGAARDAHWGIPANATARLALQALGATTIRTDVGYSERYFANLTDGGSNPGGRETAGWYVVSIPEDTGWITPTLAAGWAVPASYYQTLQYRRIGSRVEFRGAATGTTTADPLFTLPTNFRPGITVGDELYYAVLSANADPPVMTRVVIRQNGTVAVVSTKAPNFDVISFRTN